MSSMHRTLRCFAALALVACADVPSTSPDIPSVPSAARQAQQAPDRYIVVFEDSVRDAGRSASRLAAAHDARLRHVWNVGLRGFSAHMPAAAAEALRRNPAVRSVSPVEIFQVSNHTTQTGATWGLDRVDQRALPLSGAYTYASSGAGVNVYLIDTGLFPEHQDFAGRASVLYDARPEDGLEGRDCYGHGTHVGGTIVGTTWGVAKQATLYSVKVNKLCTRDVYTDDWIDGINYVTANHDKPAVANISIGGGANSTIDGAVQQLINAGVTVVVSAGNDDGANACLKSPARVADAVTVAASTIDDARPYFSNLGSCVDLFAPGESITSAGLASASDTEVLSGTSMAAPHVTGAVALVLQGNTLATPSQVASTIVSRATPSVLTNVGTGSPNRLLYAVPPVTTKISGPSMIESAGTYTWTARPAGGSGHYTYQWMRKNVTGYTTPYLVGTSEQLSMGITSGPSFDLILTVTDGSESATAMKFVRVYINGCGVFGC